MRPAWLCKFHLQQELAVAHTHRYIPPRTKRSSLPPGTWARRGPVAAPPCGYRFMNSKKKGKSINQCWPNKVPPWKQVYESKERGDVKRGCRPEKEGEHLGGLPRLLQLARLHQWSQEQGFTNWNINLQVSITSMNSVTGPSSGPNVGALLTGGNIARNGFLAWTFGEQTSLAVLFIG